MRYRQAKPQQNQNNNILQYNPPTNKFSCISPKNLSSKPRQGIHRKLVCEEMPEFKSSSTTRWALPSSLPFPKILSERTTYPFNMCSNKCNCPSLHTTANFTGWKKSQQKILIRPNDKHHTSMRHQETFAWLWFDFFSVAKYIRHITKSIRKLRDTNISGIFSTILGGKKIICNCTLLCHYWYIQIWQLRH